MGDKHLEKQHPVADGDVPNNKQEPTTQLELFNSWVERTKEASKQQCQQHRSIWSQHPPAGSAAAAAACAVCADRDRAFLRKLRGAAVHTVNFYTALYLNPRAFRPWPRDALRSLIIVLIQTVLPTAIIVQVLGNEEGDGAFDLCPNRSDPFGRISAFFLSAFFGLMTMMTCQGKLRGIMFLLDFVPLGRCRYLFLLFAAASNFVGAVVASIGQYLLFIQRGDSSYFLLLVSSLTMQFTLQVDMSFKSSSEAERTGKAITALSKDEFLGGGAGVGDEGSPMPLRTAALIRRTKIIQFFALRFFLALSIVLTVGVTVCI